jgi:hypothetical protein
VDNESRFLDLVAQNDVVVDILLRAEVANPPDWWHSSSTTDG